jgi:hypothetical protein
LHLVGSTVVFEIEIKAKAKAESMTAVANFQEKVQSTDFEPMIYDMYGVFCNNMENLLELEISTKVHRKIATAGWALV